MRTCDYCGKTIDDTRKRTGPARRYCDNGGRCKQAAWRQKRDETLVREAVRLALTSSE